MGETEESGTPPERIQSQATDAQPDQPAAQIVPPSESLDTGATQEQRGYSWGGKWLDEQGGLRQAVAEALLELAPDGALIPGLIREQVSSLYDTVRKNRGLFPNGLESLVAQLGPPFRIERQRSPAIDWFLPDEAQSLNRALILPQIQTLISPDNVLKVRDVYSSNRTLYGFVRRNSGVGKRFKKGFESLVNELGLDCRVEKQERTDWISRAGVLNRSTIEPLLATLAKDGVIHRATLHANSQGQGLLHAVAMRSGPGKQFPHGFQSLIDQLNLPYRYERREPEQWAAADGSLNTVKIRTALQAIAGDRTTIHAGDIQRRNVSLYNFIRRQSGAGQLFPDNFGSVPTAVDLDLTIVQGAPKARRVIEPTINTEIDRRRRWSLPDGSPNHSAIREELLRIGGSGRLLRPSDVKNQSIGLYHYIRTLTGPNNVFPDGLNSVVKQLALPYEVVTTRDSDQVRIQWRLPDGTLNRPAIERVLTEVAGSDGVFRPWQVGEHRQGLYQFVRENTGPDKLFPHGFQSLVQQLGLDLRVEAGHQSWVLADGRFDLERAKAVIDRVAATHAVVRPTDIEQDPEGNALLVALRRGSGPGKLFPHGLESLIKQVAPDVLFEVRQTTEWMTKEGVLNRSAIEASLARSADEQGVITVKGLQQHSSGLFDFLRTRSGPGQRFPNGPQSLIDELDLPYTMGRGRDSSDLSTFIPSAQPSPERRGWPHQPGQRVDFAEVEAQYTERSFVTVVDDRPLKPVDARLTSDREPLGRLEEELFDLTTGLSLTGAEQLRLLIGQSRDKYASPEAAKLYAQYVGELPTYLVHRARIAVLAQYFFEQHRTYPSHVADLGAGPSIGYQAYQELASLFHDRGIEPPHITDIDSSLAMLDEGLNPDRRYADISERLPLASGSVELVESSYVLHHFAPEAIRRTLGEAHRVLRWGTYLVLVSPVRFSQDFLGGVRLLGFDVQTQYGTKLAATDEFLSQLSSLEQQRAKDKLASSYLLIARKHVTPHPDDLPTADHFTFDRILGGLHPSWENAPTEHSLWLRDVRGRVEQLLHEVGRAFDQLRTFDQSYQAFFRYGKPRTSVEEYGEYRRELRIWLEKLLTDHIQALAPIKEAMVDALTWQQLTVLRLKIQQLSRLIDGSRMQ